MVAPQKHKPAPGPTDSRATALPGRRRADLVSYIEGAGQATVAELADEFDVSLDTIRRDLDQLAETGDIVRTHGGALAKGDLATSDTPFASRMSLNKEAKARIARTAATFISDGETILMNGGTTVLALAAALGGRRGLTVVTNNLRVPFELAPGVASDLYIVGGSCRPVAMVTIGPVQFAGSAGHTTHAISADVAVIGVGGISSESGLTTSSLPEAQMMREMIESSARVIVIADQTKVGRSAFAHICDFSKVDTVVTEGPVPEDVARAAREAGCAIVTA